MDARLERLLTDASGPAPWYSNALPSFRIGADTWTWRSEPTGGDLGWPVLQRDADGARCFVPAFYTYVARAGDEWLLTWRSRLSGTIEIRLYPVAELGPVDLPHDYPRREGDLVSRRASEVVRIPPLEGGLHEGFAARTPIEIDELLLLAHRPLPADDDPALAIYAWRPASGRITVSPQPWFTPATHDLGYEWVTKVARDPESGRILGAGIRVPAFELEDDCMTVRRWLADAWGQPIAGSGPESS
jgi:hypothetical protein